MGNKLSTSLVLGITIPEEGSKDVPCIVVVDREYGEFDEVKILNVIHGPEVIDIYNTLLNGGENGKKDEKSRKKHGL